MDWFNPTTKSSGFSGESTTVFLEPQSAGMPDEICVLNASCRASSLLAVHAKIPTRTGDDL
jgi:hypothetical protein